MLSLKHDVKTSPTIFKAMKTNLINIREPKFLNIRAIAREMDMTITTLIVKSIKEYSENRGIYVE